MGVLEAAVRLFDWPSARDDTFTKYLTGGLPEKEIARLLDPTGIQQPAEAVEFYLHFTATWNLYFLCVVARTQIGVRFRTPVPKGCR